MTLWRKKTDNHRIGREGQGVPIGCRPTDFFVALCVVWSFKTVLSDESPTSNTNVFVICRSFISVSTDDSSAFQHMNKEGFMIIGCLSEFSRMLYFINVVAVAEIKNHICGYRYFSRNLYRYFWNTDTLSLTCSNIKFSYTETNEF